MRPPHSWLQNGPSWKWKEQSSISYFFNHWATNPPSLHCSHSDWSESSYHGDLHFVITCLLGTYYIVVQLLMFSDAQSSFNCFENRIFMNFFVKGYSVRHARTWLLPQWNAVSQLSSLSLIVSFSDKWYCHISAVCVCTYVLYWPSHSVCVCVSDCYCDRWFMRFRFLVQFIWDSSVFLISVQPQSRLMNVLFLDCDCRNCSDFGESVAWCQHNTTNTLCILGSAWTVCELRDVSVNLFHSTASQEQSHIGFMCLCFGPDWIILLFVFSDGDVFRRHLKSYCHSIACDIFCNVYNHFLNFSNARLKEMFQKDFNDVTIM